MLRASCPLTESADGRESLQPGDAVLLIAEDDPRYARTLHALARDDGLQRRMEATKGNHAVSLCSLPSRRFDGAKRPPGFIAVPQLRPKPRAMAAMMHSLSAFLPLAAVLREPPRDRAEGAVLV